MIGPTIQSTSRMISQAMTIPNLSRISKNFIGVDGLSKFPGNRALRVLFPGAALAEELATGALQAGCGYRVAAFQVIGISFDQME